MNIQLHICVYTFLNTRRQSARSLGWKMPKISTARQVISLFLRYFCSQSCTPFRVQLSHRANFSIARSQVPPEWFATTMRLLILRNVALKIPIVLLVVMEHKPSIVLSFSTSLFVSGSYPSTRFTGSDPIQPEFITPTRRSPRFRSPR